MNALGGDDRNRTGVHGFAIRRLPLFYKSFFPKQERKRPNRINALRRKCKMEKGSLGMEILTDRDMRDLRALVNRMPSTRRVFFTATLGGMLGGLIPVAVFAAYVL